ncbi:dihydropteroate synthase [Maribacter hydrothermalis]|uniref:Dihydropteroate synthase n=1 Tax=Maribacter hydrothermalis TaxID=1836467 RepID=A0A1B7Z1Z2_9FLAO|nr:dihydropteroate synthase [Maribacter hydrothermalis]APQ19345.1 dihydropteroate synthase [Maribacter hydrothermalis]OBR36741.1 dihydropteroate synthase [Maribacter hydrothermalis]
MTINCNGKLISLDQPKVMGILNVTPDSFFDGGKYKDETSILHQVEKMHIEGATFIDIGAYSSRPGALEINEETELKRILPIVSLIKKNFPNTIISIDTFRSKVAHECIGNGAAIVNDISAGLQDEKMLSTVAKLNVPYVMMHMRGTSQNMQKQTDYKDILKEVLYFFSERLAAAKALGIKDIIIDPGFGFAKNLEQNYELLNHLELMNGIEHPLLVGISRKSMIYKIVGTTPDLALNGTTALHMVCLQKGAKIVRVHDVKEAVECVKLYEQLNA